MTKLEVYNNTASFVAIKLVSLWFMQFQEKIKPYLETDTHTHEVNNLKYVNMRITYKDVVRNKTSLIFVKHFVYSIP